MGTDGQTDERTNGVSFEPLELLSQLKMQFSSVNLCAHGKIYHKSQKEVLNNQDIYTF